MKRRRATTGRGRRTSPYRLFTLAALLAGGGVAVALRLRFGVDWLIAYLAGVNASTILLYAYDKAAAIRGTWVRVPERVLHGAALAGGTPAALLAQGVLRHKTIKPSFRAGFFAIVVLQVLAVVAWAYWRHHDGIPS